MHACRSHFIPNPVEQFGIMLRISAPLLRDGLATSSERNEAVPLQTLPPRALASGEAAAIPCNISRKVEVEGLIKETHRRFGRIDILVCNAAINPVFGPLRDLTDEAFDKVMGANVKSNLWLCNLAIPGMAERGGGAVVIISSIGGMRGSEMLGAYAISKSADFALARGLAVEWGPKNVRVNCVAPGLVRTDFARAR